MDNVTESLLHRKGEYIMRMDSGAADFVMVVPNEDSYVQEIDPYNIGH